MKRRPTSFDSDLLSSFASFLYQNYLLKTNSALPNIVIIKTGIFIYHSGKFMYRKTDFFLYTIVFIEFRIHIKNALTTLFIKYFTVE